MSEAQEYQRIRRHWKQEISRSKRVMSVMRRVDDAVSKKGIDYYEMRISRNQLMLNQFKSGGEKMSNVTMVSDVIEEVILERQAIIDSTHNLKGHLLYLGHKVDGMSISDLVKYTKELLVRKGE